jgi:hypothetical protein
VTIRFPFSSHLTGFVRHFLILCLVGIPSISAAKPKEISSQSVEPRDHYLFVGIDLFVRDGGKQVKIVKLDGKNAILDTPNRDTIRIDRTSGLLWKMAPKVSPNFIKIDVLKVGATYTHSRAGLREELSNQMGLQNLAADSLDIAEEGMREARVVAAEASASSGELREGEESPQGIVAEATSIIDQAVMMQDSLTDAGFLGAPSDSDLERVPNTIEMSFQLSSDRPLARAHVVGTAIVLSGEEFYEVSFHQRVGKVTGTPKKFTIQQPGLPRDFEIKQSSIHVFSHGEELASNHSEKRYELTAQEAQQFVTLDHTGIHRRQTTPASPSWSLAPRAFHASASPREFDYIVTVEVSPAGDFESFSNDGQILPDSIRQLVQQMVFLPALEAGKPIASTLTFNLADFFKTNP